jgi:TonB-linked SusC/RagA family outer membrane protein
MKLILQISIPWYKIMKVTLSQLIIAIMLTGMSYSKTTKAQEVLEKKITATFSNIPLGDALKAIQKNNHVKFIYNQNLVDNNLHFSSDFKDENLKKVLDKFKASYGISYEVLNNSIILQLPSRPKVMENVVGSAPVSVTIVGQVTDEKGETIPGVSVTLKGSTIGTVTDKNGNYKLPIENTQAAGGTLVFSFLGYNTLELQISGRTTINAQLVGESKSLNEVVVVAYGSTKKRDLTGAVSSVTATDIEKTISLTPQQAMQGRMAGVLVTTAGGDPNDAPKVRIRGVTTFSGQNADPLYVVDGVVINDYGSKSVFSVSQQKAEDIMGTQNVYNLINPDDIESISVLKDATSAAAYGSRAANGVVLITTKHGRDGKAKVSLSAQFGVSNVPKTLSVLNTQQYVAIENEAHAGDPNFTGSVYSVFNPSSPNYLGNSPTYDWQKEIQNKNAPFQDYNLTVSGGNPNAHYYVSGGYADYESDLKFNDQKRYTFSTRTDFKVNNFFDVGQTLRLAYTDLDDQRNTTGNAADLFNTRRIKPWQPIYDPNGYLGFAEALPNTYGGVSPNFIAIPSTVHHSQGTVKTLGNAYATITPVKNLHITGTIGIDYTTFRRLSLSTDSSALFNGNGTSTGNEIGDLNSTNFTLTKRVNATYSIKTGKHTIDLYAHAEQENFNYHYSIADQAGITGVSDPYLFQADGGKTSTGITGKDQTAHQGYLGRVNYKYNDRYYLDVTVLRQGSSIFNPDGYQWGTFPSVAGAWRISSENFMKNSPFDDLKIRGGIGQLGNDDTQAFQYLSLVQNQFAQYLVNGTPITGAFLSNYPNTSLTWEHITTYNIGFEGTFKRNLSFSAEYYDRQTSNILQVYSLPASTGLSNNPYKNIGAASNKGVEITMNYQNNLGDFKYNAGFNFTTVDNKVTKLDNNLPVGTPGGFVVLGDPIGSIYGYKSAGVIKTQSELQAYQAKFAGSQYVSSLQLGDLMYQDLAGAPTAADIAAGRQYHRGGDGKIDSYDGLIKLGKTIPGYFYGINLGGAYKNFDFSILLSGVGDVQKVNTVKQDGTTYGLQNQLTSVLDHWTPSNPNSNNPRAIGYGISNANNTQFSDIFVESAAYLRLSNVQIGYTFPQNIFGKNQTIDKLRVFLGGSNLFTITKYTGYDPENDLIPPARTILIGLNMSF